jgi:serine/threonine-protein kinase
MRADLAALDAAPEPDGPPDERQWLRATALVHTLATAAALWALLVSVTPRVIPPGAVEPLVMLGAETLPDGRLVSRARFETGPTLAAVAAVVLAVAAQGLLRRHWRLGRLDQPRPHRSVPESRTVLALGVVAGVVYGLRHLLDSAGVTLPSAYIPILGGLLELAVLYCCWIAVLEAWRTRRPLRREPRLLLGVAIALVPPVVDLLGYLRSWRP